MSSSSRPILLRVKRVQEETGFARSTLYVRVAEGLLPRPVRLGARAVAWPAEEIAAVNQARIAGSDESQIRRLVAQLTERRAHQTDA